MLYSEFVENTGCKETDYNYLIYKRLELIYMNDDTVSKQDIYEYGKKLVDNSKTEAEIEFENQINAEIAGHKSQIEGYKKDLEFENYMLSIDSTKGRKAAIKYTKDAIKAERRKIKELKWILGQI